MIIAIGMVKNEADIIEAFVRHTLLYVDRVYLIENGSQDETPEILRRLQEEGLALDVTHDPGFKYNQAFRTTALYRKVLLEHKPEFVVPLDADEFIQAPSREHFRFLLSTIPPNGVGTWRWRTCLPSKPQELELSKRFPVARRHENPNHGKVILRAPAHGRDSTLEISQGNHSASRSNRKLRGVVFEDMHLAHLPIRSIQQLAQKVILGWMANVAQFKTTSPTCGFHWGELYRRVLELTPEDLVREAYNYSEYASRTDLDVVASALQVEGRLNCASNELDITALLKTVCANWEASLLV